MPTPLVFKGDKKTSKKRKRTERDDATDDGAAPKTSVKPAEAVENDDSWVSAEATTDVSGPLLFVLPTDAPSCIACDANGKVFTSQLENLIEDDPTTSEPHDVRQVWVGNRVAGTENFSFKGHHGRYLSCDKFGILSATREAVGPEESFVVVPVADTPGGFALQTQRDRFLVVDEEKGSASADVRGDAEFIEFRSTLRIRMQARFKPRSKARKEEKARENISRKELEEMVGRRLGDEEVKMLKRARREGDFHERLLDVKVKGKHDKYA